MEFEYSDKVQQMRKRLLAFMEEHIYPNEEAFHHEVDENRRKGNAWVPTTVVESLKPKAREAGLWNLFLPRSTRVPEGLNNLEYAPLCEIMGRVHFAPEVFNCSAPDTGNMETLERYASEAIKREWLDPLLRGEIRSAFAMTEPDVASSDATNIQCRIERQGDHYVINGRKWWTSGAGDPRCKVLILMGKTNPDAGRHEQQSMIVVPRDTAGITVKRALNVFGYDDAPHGHCEVIFENVKIPVDNILLGEGRGFEIAQGRLGDPGQDHRWGLVPVRQRGARAHRHRRRVLHPEEALPERGFLLRDHPEGAGHPQADVHRDFRYRTHHRLDRPLARDDQRPPLGPPLLASAAGPELRSDLPLLRRKPEQLWLDADLRGG
ncbi:MAG: hypothetical protein RLY65_1138, partial [Pseudomonadota bacterium]